MKEPCQLTVPLGAVHDRNVEADAVVFIGVVQAQQPVTSRLPVDMISSSWL
jgi:hypothetical protein